VEQKPAKCFGIGAVEASNNATFITARKNDSLKLIII